VLVTRPVSFEDFKPGDRFESASLTIAVMSLIGDQFLRRRLS
jgi:hypothetical protein